MQRRTASPSPSKLNTGLSEEQMRFLAASADGLFRFSLGYFTRGTIVDIVAWVPDNTPKYSSVRFAFVANGVKISNVFGMPYGESRVEGRAVDHHLKRALNIDTSWTGGAQYSGHMHPSELFDWIGNYLNKAYGGDDAFTESRTTMIVEPGYPWPADWYYSAKAQNFIQPQKPAWLIPIVVDEARHGARHEGEPPREGVNPCVVFPPDDTKTQAGGHVFGLFDDDTEMMVAHSMHLMSPNRGFFHKRLDAAVAGINACGGFLFPSLSVGPIPATNFGPIVMVGRLELVTAALKPYRERGRNPSWVYDTDTWTVGTLQLMTDVALKLFEEFHGHDDWIYGTMWSLGPPADAGSAPGRDESPPLGTMSALRRAIRQRMKYWRRNMTDAAFKAMAEQCAGTECAYGYCEAKAREVVRLEEFPYIVAPSAFADSVNDFVRGTGYRGDVLFVEETQMNDVAHLAESGGIPAETAYRWAWEVADVVRGLQTIAHLRT